MQRDFDRELGPQELHEVQQGTRSCSWMNQCSLISTDRVMLCSRAALQRRCRCMKNWTWHGNVYLQLRKPTLFWASSKAAWPADWGKWFPASALLLWDPTWSAASSSAPEWHGHLREGLAEDLKNYQRAGTPLQQKKSKRVHIGKKKAPGEPPFYISLFKEEFLRNIERKFLLEFVVTRQGVMFYTESWFNLDKRKRFFKMKVLKHWNSLPTKVYVPPLEVPKVRLSRAFSNLL